MSVFTTIQLGLSSAFQSGFRSGNYLTGSLKQLSLLLLLSIQATTTFSAASVDNIPKAPVSPYSANYSAKFSGLEIEAVQRLEEIEPGLYRESLTAKNFLGQIDEQSTFSLTDKHLLRPTEYSYVRSVFGRTKTEVQRFDWQNKALHYQKNDSHKQSTLEVGQLDMITHRLQLRRDLNAGLTEFSYPVISRGKLKQYAYRVVANEVLETAIGPLATVKVERVVDADSKSQFTAWLAKDWEHLIVKLEQKKNGDSHQLELRSAVINNQTVQPLNRTQIISDGSTE
ncbi:DUF3108 domain-containing protein [Porticoccaceae bacterium]|nr:DUF3108 domain-containing protein [Porticoccaceae bacterium]